MALTEVFRSTLGSIEVIARAGTHGAVITMTGDPDNSNSGSFYLSVAQARELLIVLGQALDNVEGATRPERLSERAMRESEGKG